jgi:hypothetical protein
MKYLLLSLVIPLSLVARLNPFEPVDAPAAEMKPEILQPIPVNEKIMTKDDGDRTVKIMSEEKVKKAVPKVVIKEKIVTEKLTKKQLEEECKVLDVNKTKVVVKPKPKPKPKPQFKAKTFKLLPFLTVDSKKKSMTIKTRYKYKLIKYIDDKGNKKFIFDFKGKVITSTKHRKIMNNPYFKGFRVGNHPKEKFFRVVIDTKRNTSKYRVSVKNNVVTLSYK